MKRFRLDFTSVFRRFGQREQGRWAAAIRALSGRPKEQPDGRPVGGSLAEDVKRPVLLKIKPWGYVIALSQLGQKLTWLVRGTRRQRARPLPPVKTDVDALAKALEAEAQRQFTSYDRSARA